jgi:hypothetical protein
MDDVPYFGEPDNSTQTEVSHDDILRRFLELRPDPDLDDVCNPHAMGCLLVKFPLARAHALFVMPPTAQYDTRRQELCGGASVETCMHKYADTVEDFVKRALRPVQFAIPRTPDGFLDNWLKVGKFCQTDKSNEHMARALYNAHTPLRHALVTREPAYRAFVSSAGDDEVLIDKVVYAAIETVVDNAKDAVYGIARYIAQLQIGVDSATSRTRGQWRPHIRTVHTIVYVRPGDFYVSPSHDLFICNPDYQLVGPFPDAVSCLQSWGIVDTTHSMDFMRI